LGAVKAEKRKLAFLSNDDNRKQQDDFNAAIDKFVARY
jgi:hypothetical protein